MTLPHDPAARQNRLRPTLAALAGLALTAAAVAQDTPTPAVVPATQLTVQEVLAPAEDAPDAVPLLQDARRRLDGYRTLKADVTEVVEFGPRRFAAEGVYLQTADRKVRLDLSIKLGKASTRLLQVCDGDLLWTVYGEGDAPQVTRRDVNQIAAALGKKGEVAEAALVADLGLGGLAAILANVERRMDFRPPLATTVDGRRFYVLEGTWKADIGEFLHSSAGGPDKPLPIHVPDGVRMYLDAETLFPYRIRYLKVAKPGTDGKPGESPAPVMTLDFERIVVNAPVDPADFRFVPPEGAVVTDVTTTYVQNLNAIQAPPEPPQP